MKKVLIIPLLCLAVLYGWADEQRKMTLGSDNTSETINLSYCNIFVALLNPDSDDPPMVQVEVENLDETKLLALFCQPYTEKQVKKLNTLIAILSVLSVLSQAGAETPMRQ